MKFAPNHRLAKRCAVGLVVASIAGWSLAVLVEGSQSARAQSLAQEQYQLEVQYQYQQFALGHVAELFGRVR